MTVNEQVAIDHGLKKDEYAKMKTTKGAQTSLTKQLNIA